MAINRYFAIVTPGLQEYVAQYTRESLPNVGNMETAEGFISFESDSGPGELAGIGCYNNVFAAIRHMPHTDSLTSIMRAVLSDIAMISDTMRALPEFRSFRVVTMAGNTPVSTSAEMAGKIEHAIAAATPLVINRHNPDTELWIISRNEGWGIAGIRLRSGQQSAGQMRQGELRPSLAYTLASMGATTKDHVVVDPFAGTGSIPWQLIGGFDFKKLVAADHNGVIISNSIRQLARRDSRIEVRQANALNMPFLTTGSVDAVITDPPWGVFKPLPDPERFYRNFLIEAARILRTGGRLVLLSSQKNVMKDFLTHHPSLYDTLATYDILVSGQKASVHIWQRADGAVDPLIANPVPDLNHAERQFGQNYLTNRTILEREVQYALIRPEDRVIEIGPAFGHLTEMILAGGAVVHAVEIDPFFKPYLQDLAGRYPSFTFSIGDALTSELPMANKVIANLPYRISLPLLFRILELDFKTGVFIIQEDLAKRLYAKPGKPGYGRLSVTMRRICSVKILEAVKPYEFMPPPDVTSSLIRIQKIAPRFAIPGSEYFRTILDHLFHHRDLVLEAALAKIPGYPARAKGLGGAIRPLMRKKVSTLDPGEFGKITAALHEAGIEAAPLSNEAKRTAQKKTG